MKPIADAPTSPPSAASPTTATASATPPTSPAATRAAIESALLAWMAEPDWRRDEARFETLALALFRFQYAACEPYRRYADALGRTPANVLQANAIPPVPTGAFKEFELRCFPVDRTVLTFRTSGTSTERRGALHLDTLALYEASLLASLRRCFLTDLVGRRPTMRFLAPSPQDAPDSSLTHMFATLAAAEGSERSGYDLTRDGLALDPLAQAIDEAWRDGAPIVLAGTSFAFVHFLDATEEADALAAAGAVDAADATDAANADGARGARGDGSRRGRWQLPPGSRVLETGGFKGRSREVPREELRAALAARFGIPERAILNQYGMTELGSQFYDSTLLDPQGPRRKLVPPWTRVRCVDPDSGEDVPIGEVGLIVIHDLANTGSVAAIQTADLGRLLPAAEGGGSAGFDVLGRAAGAEQRGCSIAVDAMLDPRTAAAEATGARTAPAPTGRSAASAPTRDAAERPR